MDINAISGALNNNTPTEVKVSLVSLGGVNDYTITAGTTVREFKTRNGISDVKIVTTDGTALRDEDTISADVQLFISTPKKNG